MPASMWYHDGASGPGKKKESLMSGSASGGACDRCAGCVVKWTIIATVFQIAVVILGYCAPFIRDNLFAIGGIV